MAQISRGAAGKEIADGSIRSRKASNRRLLTPIARHAVLIAVTVVLLVPFYWMLISAFKENSKVFTQPIQWWPNPLRLDNVSRALNYPGFPFLRFLWNSVFYA
ncbi:MAG TPA: hypothetical protein VFX76_14270, partial [Roseiflexaceae bacterium]|nr:hypothetical protein [Roseiflexaceae bacterium]